MSTVKFDLLEDLEELRARIYLDTKTKLSKKEVLELVFRIGAKNYQQLIDEIQLKEQKLDDSVIQHVLGLAEDLGPGSEGLSMKIDSLTFNLGRRKLH